MKDIIQTRITDVPAEHVNRHERYEYYKRTLVSGEYAEQSHISVYEVPPGKAAYPYHYHIKNEEAFYIISGSGLLKTPGGERAVTAGDFLFFPANEKGAHKLTNISETELLIYIDFDTRNDIDVTFYPETGKMGVWGKHVGQVHKVDRQVDYYEGE